MHQKSLLNVSLITALAVFAGPLKAFSLGQIDVRSALNQPFEADIELRSVRSDERDNLQVRLASESEFARAGLARPFALTNLQFNVVDINGDVVVRVSSDTPIKEPFLDFIVSATAGEGRMLREYTVLLDPPHVDRQPRATSPQPVASQTSNQASPSADDFPTTYRVQSDDTLWRVANRVRPDNSLSVYQVMMALFEQNPQAFSNNNINNLRADATLEIPERESISRLSAANARQAFNQQTQQWQQNRATTEAADQNTVEQSATDTSTATQAEQSAAGSEPVAESSESLPSPETLKDIDQTGQADNVMVADARLDLVAPNEALENAGEEISNQGDPDLQQMSEQLTFAQETIEAQNQENTDLKARMDNMESQIDTMRRLLSLKDADMARLQALLAENEDGIDDLAAALQAQRSGEMTESDSAGNTDTDSEPTDTSTPATSETQAPSEKPVQGLLSVLRDLGIPLALGLLLILLLSLLVIRRRRQSLHEDDVFDTTEDSISEYVETGEDNSDMVPPEVTELAQTPVVEETKSTAELIEQADMFVGYADYTQALNTLQQARLQSPDNQQVIYKRLFVLYKLQRTNDFVEQLAEVEYAGDSEEWQQIINWGHDLDPSHPLFRDAAPAAASEPPAEARPLPETTPSEAPETDNNVSAEYAESFDTLPGEETTADEPDLEFILDEPPVAESDSEHDTASSEPTVAEDDFSEPTETSDPTASIEPVSLDIDDNEPSQDDATQAESDNTGPDDDDGISLDFSDTEHSNLSSDAPGIVPSSDNTDDDDELTLDLSDYDDVDELETKLDLAAAYIDMGDQEAAQGILEEVVNEGNDAQQERARTLLDSLN